jgi:cyclophilin family peptidyl-prolyl cis-trans isomerase
LLLFGALVVLFTPPTIVLTDATHNDAISDAVSAVANHTAAIAIVTCEVSTPHSEHPETAAGGKFDIAILSEDIDRKGSSAEAFLKLVDDQFYNGVYTFRVINGFVVQWGHRSDHKKKPTPASERIPESDITNKMAGSKISEGGANDFGIEPDDSEVRKLQILERKQNVRGTITMIAGRTGQVFVNTGDNRRLDRDGTLPFGVILETTREDPKRKDFGMAMIDSIYHDYKGGEGQIPAINNNQVPTKFPEMGRIDRCYRLG